MTSAALQPESGTAEAPVDGHGDDPRPLGPDSLTWHRFGDWRTALLTSWAGALQAMHPIIDVTLVQHSDVFDNETARLARSSVPIVRALYDRTGGEAQRIRDFHTNIKGVTGAGDRYHALSPDPYFWAHATFLNTQFVVAEYFAEPLTGAEKEQLYRESVQWYALYGMTMTNVPRTYAEFERYWDETVCTVLTRSETIVRSRILNNLPTARPNEHIPRIVWFVLGPKLAHLLGWITRGTLPPVARAKLGWEWTAKDERKLRRFGAAVRIGFRLIPPPLRLLPAARHALRDSA